MDDVFSAYNYTGNGGTQTINNGIDLTQGGLVSLIGRVSTSDPGKNARIPLTITIKRHCSDYCPSEFFWNRNLL